ncbi:hypothetical protein HD553DRAFT_334473 [Filobasidium floriforme]|uniref:uncharacterized protein n=1 Tax=Filobasidium floriforme TaxID=5210 RepID=UPI001E8D6320|nr:uncharacterized protein HD553DRAFT_334473 [Filobasidium floriforme]KAH8087440.1 hypothetical protein HD553DRAFT_334473 [Filobasidium floriforme]
MPALTEAQLEQFGLALLSPRKGQSLGPFLITLFLDAMFYGILCMQAFKFFTESRRDSLFHRVVAGSILALATAVTALSMSWMYNLFVLNFGSYAHFFSVKYLSWFYVFDCCAMVIVQSFFAHRAFQLTKRNYYILGVIVFFMVTAFITGILMKVRGQQLGSSADPDDVYIKAFVYSWLGATLIADTLITLTIMSVLIRRRTGWKTTDRLITRLLKLTFESQLPPTVIAISTACQYATLVNTAPYISIPLLQSKIYAFALFHTLNSRSGLTNNQNDFTINTASGFSVGDSSFKAKNSHGGIEPVKVTTETYTHTEPIDIVLESWPARGHFSNRRSDVDLQVDVERQDDGDKDIYGSKDHIVAPTHPFTSFEKQDSKGL